MLGHQANFLLLVGSEVNAGSGSAGCKKHHCQRYKNARGMYQCEAFKSSGGHKLINIITDKFENNFTFSITKGRHPKRPPPVANFLSVVAPYLLRCFHHQAQFAALVFHRDVVAMHCAGKTALG